MTNYNGKLYFFTGTATQDNELWVTDGTNTGTQKIKSLLPAFTNWNVTPITIFNGKMYFFTAQYHGNIYYLWQSDGTENGTTVVMTHQAISAMDLTVFNNSLYYVLSDVGAARLLRYDGVSSTSVMIERTAGVPFDMVSAPFVSGNKLYFHADGALWQTDGTIPGNTKLADVSTVSSMTQWNGRIYFSANDGAHGEEPWITDGTPSGTFMLKDIEAGAGNSYPSTFIAANGKLFFIAGPQSANANVWVTDGTSGGTVMLPAATQHYSEMIAYNGKVYFDAIAGARHELWSTDGTISGTQLLSNEASFARNYYIYAGKLFFMANSNDPAKVTLLSQLWYTDGTTVNTEMLSPATPQFPAFRSENRMTEYNSDLYFAAAYNNKDDYELWKLHLPTASLGGNDMQSSPQLYPNPASETFYVRMPAAAKVASLKIYNLTGQLVHQQQLTETNAVDIHKLISGIYFAYITADGVTGIRKFVKQ
jgi:hypothetical protein